MLLSRLVLNEVGISYRNKAMKVNLWDTMSGINLCLIRALEGGTERAEDSVQEWVSL